MEIVTLVTREGFAEGIPADDWRHIVISLMFRKPVGHKGLDLTNQVRRRRSNLPQFGLKVVILCSDETNIGMVAKTGIR